MTGRGTAIGRGFLAIWSDVEADALTDYLHWLTREHTMERVTTDGFRGVRVFRAEGADPARFAILYDLDSAEILDGPAYLARLNAPTPWSRRIMPRLGAFVRGGGTIVAAAGSGAGGVCTLLRLDAVPEDPEALAAGLVRLDRIAAVRVGVTDAGRTGVATAEKAMRRQDDSFAALLTIEALDEGSLRAALREAARLRPGLAGPADRAGTVRAMFSLDRPA